MSALKNWIKRVFTQPPIVIAAPVNVLPEPPVGHSELPKHTSTGMVKLGIIVGHDKEHPGARITRIAVPEYEWNKVVASHIAALQPEYPGVELQIIFRDGVGIAGAYAEARAKNCDCVIELHFNAADGKASGTETLCSIDGDDIDFAHVIQKAMCQFFKRVGDSRGVKVISKADRGGVNLYSFPGGPNCLVEPFFGDSEPEMSINPAGYAKCLLDAVVLWAKHKDLLR